MSQQMYGALFDGVSAVIVLADENYIIRYVNDIGVDNYRRFGGRDIVGTSLFDCHNDHSCQVIREIYDGFKSGDLKSKIVVQPQDDRVKHIVYLPVFHSDEFKGCMEIQYFEYL